MGPVDQWTNGQKYSHTPFLNVAYQLFGYKTDSGKLEHNAAPHGRTYILLLAQKRRSCFSAFSSEDVVPTFFMLMTGAGRSDILPEPI